MRDSPRRSELFYARFCEALDTYANGIQDWDAETGFSSVESRQPVFKADVITKSGALSTCHDFESFCWLAVRSVASSVDRFLFPRCGLTGLDDLSFRNPAFLPEAAHSEAMFGSCSSIHVKKTACLSN